MRIHYRNVKKIAYYILGVGILLAVGCMLAGVANLFLPIAILILFSLVYVVLVFYFFRCPYCNALLPTWRRSVPDYCPCCGESIDD